MATGQTSESSCPASVQNSTSRRSHSPPTTPSSSRRPIRPRRSKRSQRTLTATELNSRAADSAPQPKVLNPHPCRDVSAGQRPAQWGGWDSNPRPTDYESFENLGDPCQSMLIFAVFPGQARFGASALPGPCQSFPILVSNLRPERVPEGQAQPASETITAARECASNPRATDWLTNEVTLHPSSGGASSPTSSSEFASQTAGRPGSRRFDRISRGRSSHHRSQRRSSTYRRAP